MARRHLPIEEELDLLRHENASLREKILHLVRLRADQEATISNALADLRVAKEEIDRISFRARALAKANR